MFLGIFLLGGTAFLVQGTLANDGRTQVVGIQSTTGNSTTQASGKMMGVSLASAVSAQETDRKGRIQLIEELNQKLDAAQSPEQRKQIINEFRAKDRALSAQGEIQSAR